MDYRYQSRTMSKKYMDMGGDVIKYCEVTSAGLGRTWSLKKEYYEESDMEGEQ